MTARSQRALHRGVRQRGMALALVVWFIAGMSLLVAGIVASARTDTRMAQLHRAQAQSSSAGDGAINLLLADLLEGGFEAQERSLVQGRYRVGELDVSVVAMPVALLLDANGATTDLLRQALQFASTGAGTDPQRLAAAIVQWRSPPEGARRNAMRFDALEDLVQVDGLNRSDWDRLRDYVQVGRSGGVGAAVAQRALAVSEALSPASRARTPSLLANPQLDPELLQRRGGGFRVDAMLRHGGRIWLRRRWVELSGGRTLPWRFVRTEPTRIIATSNAAS